MTSRQAAEAITGILGLRWAPVAVNFVPAGAALPAFEAPPRRRFCQILMETRRGEKRLLTADNVSCPAVAAAFGLKPLPEKLSSGEMLVGFGIFATAQAGQATIQTMPRLPQGQYAGVATCPLEEAQGAVDVVVLEALPEQVMWIALASVHDTGGRLDFSTGVLQATCVDAVVVPFRQGKLNATLGCYGCREATDLGDDECVVGLPGEMLDRIVTNLGRLADTAIPRVRSKATYRRLGDTGA